MKRTGFYLLFLSIVFSLTACKGSGMQGDGLMSSSGRSSEVLVVCPDADWTGALGDSLREVLEAPVVGLPQNEPMFRLSHVSPADFNPIYQKQRNILICQVQADAASPRLKVEKNKWAKPQLIQTLTASCTDTLAAAFMAGSESITGYIMQGEMQRFQRAQRAQQEPYMQTQFLKKYGYSMIFPDGFIFAVKQKDFCWLRKETKYWGQNIMVYWEPYEDEKQFSQEYITALRNRYTRKYVQGSSDSSYVLVDERYYPVLSRNVEFPNAAYAVEARGLWGLFGNTGERMGGPFVSYTFLDTVTRCVVTADGFLYAPSDSKRDLMRQVEAMLLTLQRMDTAAVSKK